MKRTLTFFWERNRMDGKEAGTHFHLRKPIMQHIVRVFICVLFFQVLVKYLKINVLYE